MLLVARNMLRCCKRGLQGGSDDNDDDDDVITEQLNCWSFLVKPAQCSETPASYES